MEKQELNLKWEVLDFLKDLVIIVAIVLLIRTFLAMPFQISGQSMYSSYYDREFIIVDRLSYRIWDPKRWDVIVFKPYVNKEKKFFLKRIIWVPWDNVKIEWWDVFIKTPESEEFVKIDEKYLNEENYWATFIWWSKSQTNYTLWEDQYFVMWDNRNHSTDSRQCFLSCSIMWKTNFISKDDMTGRLFIDLWYFNFRNFSFTHPNLSITTKPKILNSKRIFDYEEL